MDGLILAIAALAFGSALLLVLGTGRALAAGGARGLARLRMQRYTQQPDRGQHPEDSGQVFRDRRFSSFAGFDRYLRNSSLAESIALELTQARLPLRVGEYLMIRVLSAVGLAYLLMAVGGNVLAIVPGAVFGYFAPKVYVGHRKAARIKALDGQLSDTLALSANSLRTGWGFMQALGQVAREMPPPISEEFTQVVQEVSIGTSQEEAIRRLLARVPSYDLELIMTAVLIQRQVGGNLAEMMDNIAHTIRERVRLLEDISTITSESRLSMWLLGLLPIILMIFMAVIQPDYVLPFLTDPRGRLMLLGAGLMEVVGVLLMRKIAAIEV